MEGLSVDEYPYYRFHTQPEAAMCAPLRNPFRRRMTTGAPTQKLCRASQMKRLQPGSQLAHNAP